MNRPIGGPFVLNLRAVALGAGLALASALVACSGGSSVTPAPAVVLNPTAAPVPTLAPASIPTVAPVANAVSVQSVPTAAPAASTIPVALPTDAASGAGGTVSLPAGAGTTIPPSTTIDEALTTTASTDTPPLSFMRQAQGVRKASSEGSYALYFLSLRFNNTVTLSSVPGFVVFAPPNLPSASVTYYLAFYDPLRPSLGWQLGFEGPAVVSASSTRTTLTFTGSSSPITFAAYTKYWFAVYARSTGAPPPTPAPTNAPTVAPTATPAPVVASQTSLAFTALGSSAAKTFTVSEAGYTGAFTVSTDGCGTAIGTSISGSTVTVTPNAVIACSVFVVGDRGALVRVPVTVTTNGLTIGIPGATASPSPSATPTAGPMSASPASVTVGLNQKVNVTVTERDSTYASGMGASIADPTLALVQYSCNNSCNGPSQTFTVVGLGGNGSTVMIVTDINRNTLFVPITVSNAGSTVTIASPTPFPTSTTLTSGALSAPSTWNVGPFRPFSYQVTSATGPELLNVTSNGFVTPVGSKQGPGFNVQPTPKAAVNILGVSGAPGAGSMTVSNAAGNSVTTRVTAVQAQQSGGPFTPGSFLGLGYISPSAPTAYMEMSNGSAGALTTGQVTFAASPALPTGAPTLPSQYKALGFWSLTNAQPLVIGAQPGTPTGSFNAYVAVGTYPASDSTRAYHLAVASATPGSSWSIDPNSSQCAIPAQQFYQNQYATTIVCWFGQSVSLPANTYFLTVVQ